MQKYLCLTLVLLSFSTLSTEKSTELNEDSKVINTNKENKNKNIDSSKIVQVTEDESRDLTAYEESIRRRAGLDPDLLEMAKVPIDEPSSDVLFNPYLGLSGIDIIKQENGVITDSTGTYRLNNSFQGNSTVNIQGKVSCSGNSKLIIANRVYC